MKTRLRIEWIPMSALKPPKDWALPFYKMWQGRKYRITGADMVDRTWRAELIEEEL